MHRLTLGVGKKPGLGWLGFSYFEKNVSQKSWLGFLEKIIKLIKLDIFLKIFFGSNRNGPKASKF